MRTICLVACVGRKQSHPALAGDIYDSPLFSKSRVYAERHGDAWFILSAKYGLISPLQRIEPYNETLNSLPIARRREWSVGVLDVLSQMLSKGDRVVILAGEKYRESLVPTLIKMGVEVEVPLDRKPIGRQLQWLKEANETGWESDVDRFYGALDTLKERLGGYRYLRDCSAKDGWPERGVYFFFDKSERRSKEMSGWRCIRVGTHAVSTGSKSTLWGRLIQHRGTAELTGNHRGSVFRKLVGQGLIEKHGIESKTWGVGTSAPKGVRILERDHEIEVSRYIGNLPFLWLSIDDAPSKESLRRRIEVNTIALLSHLSGGQDLDLPSPNWLGHACPAKRVGLSGLWNQDHTSDLYEESFLGELESLVRN